MKELKVQMNEVYMKYICQEKEKVEKHLEKIT